MNASLASNPEIIEGVINEACPACGSTSNEVIGRLPRAMHFCTFQYSHPVNRSLLIKCNNCDLWYKNPCLTRNQLDDLYSQQPESTWSDNSENRLDFQYVIKAIQAYNTTKNPAILDMGCFNGALLDFLKHHCKVEDNFSLFGIELSTNAAKASEEKGIKIIGKNYEDIEKNDCNFDIITVVDVVEHILDTSSLFHALANKLKPNGILIVVTGATDTKPFSRFKNLYYYASMPEHLAFISRKHAEWLAGVCSLRVVDYRIFKHSDYLALPLKITVQNYIFYLLNFFPDCFFNFNNQILRRFGAIRGAGIHSSKSTPDHVLVIFMKQ